MIMRKFNCFMLIPLAFFAAFFCAGAQARAGNCERAVQLYNQAIGVQDFVERQGLLTRALELDCNKREIVARIHNNLADTYEKQGRLERAIAEYHEAIEADPLCPTPHLSLGDIYTMLKRPKEAARAYDKGFLLEKYVSSEEIVASLSPRRSIKVVPAVTLYFGFNRAELGTEGKRQLKALTEAMNEYELLSYRFRLAGHTCSLGTKAYNHTLSQKRAGVVRQWLEARGMTGARLVSVGFGEERPLSDNSTEQGRRRNRRVEVRTIGVIDVGASRSAPNVMVRKALELIRDGENLLAKERYEEALEYFKKSLDLCEKEKFQGGIKAATNDLILTYRFMENWDMAEYYRDRLP